MRVVVIGGTGHIGTFLVPRLVRAGHEVVSLSRGRSPRYADDPAWGEVREVVVDRDATERDGTFARTVADVEADAVVDLICFTPESAATLVEGLRGRTGHLLHCGSIWRHGPSLRLPVTEANGAPPVGEYGIAKAAIAAHLASETASGGLVTTTLHPGHIVGPGWHPIGPLGNLDPGVWWRLSAGDPIVVPGLGAEAMHHVHADDVAQAFELALADRDAVAGEDLDVVAPSALTVRGYLEIAASWFGQRAMIEHVSWERFRGETPAEHADASWEHLSRSHVVSIDKARRLIGYAPRYEPDEAVLESLRWLVEHDRLDIARPLLDR
jgi:nucleoside-diphosphate-sugar epimerase